MRLSSWFLNNRFVGVGLRFIIGVVLLSAGIGKAPMQAEWVDVVISYGVLPEALAVWYALTLPWLEIVIGTGLILGLFTRIFSAAAMLVVISFIVGNSAALIYGFAAEDCGCFGEFMPLNHVWSLVVDAVLLLGSLLLFFQCRQFLALDSKMNDIFRRNR